MSRATAASIPKEKPKPATPSFASTRAMSASAPEASRIEWTCVCAIETGAARSAPDFSRHLDDALQLAPLLVNRQRVAVVGAGKAALRREAQVFQRHVLR